MAKLLQHEMFAITIKPQNTFNNQGRALVCLLTNIILNMQKSKVRLSELIKKIG